MKLTAYEMKQIKRWMYRNARSVELARWQFHFENGSKENVLVALENFQNEDGGFGYALEADSWNSNSSPIQTWAATEIMKEIGAPENSSVVKATLRYLASGSNFNGRRWFAQIPSNNYDPHAPWWSYKNEEEAVWGYNPTAALAGFILLYGKNDLQLYNKAVEICQEAIDTFNAENGVDNMHELSNFISLADYIKKAKCTDLANIELFERMLKDNVNRMIEKNPIEWSLSYCARPSRFIQSTNDDYFEDNKDLVESECNLLIKTQNENHVWDVPWKWGCYEKEFVLSENWWKASLVITYVKFLKAFNKIEKQQFSDASH